MKAFHFILIFSLAALGLPGCSTPPRPQPAASAAPRAPQSHSQLPQGPVDAFAHYAAGESSFDNDDTTGALRQWEAAALADPANEPLVIEIAAQLLQNKENAKALALLSKSAARTNASAPLLAWLARAQLQAGQPGPALASSKRAIRRQPGALDGYECQTEVLFQQKRWAAAAKTLHRAASQVPSEPVTLLELADLYALYFRNQPKDADTQAQALALLDRVAQLKFSDPRLWQRLADDYARMNRQKSAADIYSRLLAHYPEPSLMRDTLHEKLAGLYMASDDRANAMKELQALLRDNPTHYPRAWFLMGELACQNASLDEAAEDFANALNGDPAIEQAYYDLAMVQLDLHKSREAFEILEQARARFPKSFAGEFYTGMVHEHVKDYPEAIRHFKEAEVIGLATESSRLDYRFYFQFGAACERAQSYKQAEEYLQKCVTLAPDFAEALNYLGYMLADRGWQLPRARLLIEKAVSLEPKNGAYLDSLGWVLFKLNQPRLALPQLLKSIQCTPEPDATELDHLGEVYLALHQIPKAVEAWKKSLSLEPSDDVKHKLERAAAGGL